MPQLTWLGDERARRAARRVPYRLLETVQSVGEEAQSENQLFQGENREALKGLLPPYAGQVKCIFFDPRLRRAKQPIAIVPRHKTEEPIGVRHS